MRTILTAYVVTALIFLGLDLSWLGSTVNSFYRPRLAGMLMEKPNLAIGGLFYLLYVVGILVFVVLPALRGGGWSHAALMGALFGFIAYATYDMTNLATLRGYSSTVAVVDLIWGTVATGVASSAGTALTAWLSRVL